MERDKLVLKSSKQIFNSIPKNKSIDELKYHFIDIAEAKYLVTSKGLDYLN